MATAFPVDWFDAVSAVGENWAYYARPEAATHIPVFLPMLPKVSTHVTHPFNISDFKVMSFNFGYKGVGFSLKSTIAEPHYSRIGVVVASNFHLPEFSYGVAVRIDEERFGSGAFRSAEIDLSACSFKDDFVFYGVVHNLLENDRIMLAGIALTGSGISGALEFVMQADRQVHAREAVRIGFSKHLDLLLGASSDPRLYGISFHFKVEDIELLYSVKFHKYLQETHVLGVSYTFD